MGIIADQKQKKKLAALAAAAAAVLAGGGVAVVTHQNAPQQPPTTVTAPSRPSRPVAPSEPSAEARASGYKRVAGGIVVTKPGTILENLEVVGTGQGPYDPNTDDTKRKRGTTGITVQATNVKIRNCIIHENSGQGIAIFAEAADVEISGCLIYRNGRSKFEHGAYSNGEQGSKLIKNNIIWNNASLGLTLHSKENNPSNYTIEGNAIYDNGGWMDNGKPVTGYGKGSRALDLGQGSRVMNSTVEDNMLIGGRFGGRALIVSPGSQVIFRDNAIIGDASSVQADTASLRFLHSQFVSAPYYRVHQVAPGTWFVFLANQNGPATPEGLPAHFDAFLPTDLEKPAARDSLPLVRYGALVVRSR